MVDEPLDKKGPYTGRAENRPKRENAEAPTMQSLVGRANVFRDSFDDVVILREVHRVERKMAGLSAEEAERYRDEADRFLEVLGRLADLRWDPQKDWPFLQSRNRSILRRTPEGRRELEEFEGAPILVDTRKKGNAGIDGALELNLERLAQVAAKKKVPIATCRAYHGYKGARGDVKAQNIDGDEFQGLPNELHLCEGARVILTHNDWVEAGLMNGAAGVVRGFIWPQGGDPNSADEQKQAPLCVVVEFDDVDLGRDAEGKPRTFSPDVTLGFDKRGKERSLKCVPIFRQEVDAANVEHVKRSQFPLTLAWALTHWKAQGMTLDRVRIRLSTKTARQAGIGFVAMSRVKHVRHLIFEDDLPEWDVFQEAQWTAGFRMRRRFELGLQAKASETLRKYGFCSVDSWTRGEAEVAERLIEGLQAFGDDRRKRQGRIDDLKMQEAWLWDDEEPCWTSLMQEQVQRVAGLLSGAERDLVQTVAERLLGPLHLPRVKQILGCLIPRELDSRWDGKKPKGRLRSTFAGAGIYLHAGSWRVDIGEEQELAEGRLLKGMLEWYLIVLRHLCEKLKLPVAVGSHTVGMALGGSQDAEDLRLKVQGMEHWPAIAASMRTAKEALFPVILEEGRVQQKCVLVRVIVGAGGMAVSYTQLTLPTNREV